MAVANQQRLRIVPQCVNKERAALVGVGGDPANQRRGFQRGADDQPLSLTQVQAHLDEQFSVAVERRFKVEVHGRSSGQFSKVR